VTAGEHSGIDPHRGTGTPVPAATPGGLLGRLRASVDTVYREIVKFGAVGAVAFVVDTAMFNILRWGLFGVEGPFEHKPLTAKAASAFIATIVAWLGNRYWTFRHRRRASRRREFVLFVGMNVAGLAIALACLWFSHYVLGLRSALADNIAGNGVGLALGTLFRFWAYKQFVFREELAEELAEEIEHAPATADHEEIAAHMLSEDLALAEEIAAADRRDGVAPDGTAGGTANGVPRVHEIPAPEALAAGSAQRREP
jgi:putative flippase GtrA